MRAVSDPGDIDVTRRTVLAAERTWLAWWRSGSPPRPRRGRRRSPRARRGRPLGLRRGGRRLRAASRWRSSSAPGSASDRSRRRSRAAATWVSTRPGSSSERGGRAAGARHARRDHRGELTLPAQRVSPSQYPTLLERFTITFSSRIPVQTPILSLSGQAVADGVTIVDHITTRRLVGVVHDLRALSGPGEEDDVPGLELIRALGRAHGRATGENEQPLVLAVLVVRQIAWPGGSS